jgi:hypothetical protein
MRLQTLLIVVAGVIATGVVAEDIVCSEPADYVNCIASAGCACYCDPTDGEVSCTGGADCESLLDCLEYCRCDTCG